MEIRAHAQRRRRSATSPTFPDTRASRHSRCSPRIEDVEHAALAVVGIPFDSGTSFRPGARFGPAHIREIHTTSSTMPTRSGTSRSSTPVTSASAPTASNRPSRRSRPRRNISWPGVRRPSPSAVTTRSPSPAACRRGRARAALGAALRRPSRHLGRAARREHLARLAVSPGCRGRAARPRALPARRYPRWDLRSERTRRRPRGRLRDHQKRSVPGTNDAEHRRPDPRAPRHGPRLVDRHRRARSVSGARHGDAGGGRHHDARILRRAPAAARTRHRRGRRGRSRNGLRRRRCDRARCGPAWELLTLIGLAGRSAEALGAR